MEWFKNMGSTITTGIAEIDVGSQGAAVAGFTLEMPCNGTLASMKIEMANAGVPTTLQTSSVVVRLKSNTITVVPMEVLAQPVSSGVGAAIVPFKEEANWIPINAPIKQGQKLQVTAAEVVLLTTHAYVGVTFMITDYAIGPQYHSQIGTLTACGAAAIEYRMTTGITIDGGVWIKAIYAYCHELDGASGSGAIYKFRLVSTGFKHSGSVPGVPALPGMGDVEFSGNFLPGMLGATLNATGMRLTRMELFQNQGIPIDGHVVIDCYISFAVALNAAGNFQVQIIYTS